MKRLAVLAACAVLAAVSTAAPHRPAKQYLLSRAQNLRSLGYPPSALVELQRSELQRSELKRSAAEAGSAKPHAHSHRSSSSSSSSSSKHSRSSSGSSSSSRSSSSGSSSSSSELPDPIS